MYVVWSIWQDEKVSIGNSSRFLDFRHGMGRTRYRLQKSSENFDDGLFEQSTPGSRPGRYRVCDDILHSGRP